MDQDPSEIEPFQQQIMLENLGYSLKSVHEAVTDPFAPPPSTVETSLFVPSSEIRQATGRYGFALSTLLDKNNIWQELGLAHASLSFQKNGSTITLHRPPNRSRWQLSENGLGSRAIPFDSVAALALPIFKHPNDITRNLLDERVNEQTMLDALGQQARDSKGRGTVDRTYLFKYPSTGNHVYFRSTVDQDETPIKYRLGIVGKYHLGEMVVTEHIRAKTRLPHPTNHLRQTDTSVEFKQKIDCGNGRSRKPSDYNTLENIIIALAEAAKRISA
ncbi:MAG TPA: hypothetical protein PKD19_00550 [Candidatus Saccharibacteria bacterium]|jgi:hypothetical protein|nr:hypothetical protein [Candidatus Saccharibacteria bacterium]